MLGLREPLPRILAGELLACLESNSQLLNTYGVTETTVDCTYRRVLHADTLPLVSSAFVPIGLPLPNYVCHVMSETIDDEEDEIGELYIEGWGVFQGYFNSAGNPVDSRLVEIGGNMCYRTGDLVKIVNGELVHLGRRDFQVKIRGQRIESGEIEGTILRECREEVNACLVRANDEKLIAYVQIREGHSISEELIKERCRQSLPTYMIPAMIVVLDRFPLNANGKIDRARLPLPSQSDDKIWINTNKSLTELETKLVNFWSRLLKIEKISLDVNLVSLGAHSLHLILATNYYSRQWLSEPSQLDFSLFFRQTTLAQHAQLLTTHAHTSDLWSCSLHQSAEGLLVGPASFAQESIWLDEQIHFEVEQTGLPMYHMIYVFRVSSTNQQSQLSVSRLRSSLRLILTKHCSLRTQVLMSDAQLIQRIQPLTTDDPVIIESWVDNDEDLDAIIADEETNRCHLDVCQGRVFRCHFIRYTNHQSPHVLIFNVHHLVFDGTSENLFFKDLSEAYKTNQLSSMSEKAINYLDYARWERTLDMSNAQMFWKENLLNCRPMELPYDRRPVNKIRSGRGSRVFVCDLDADLLFTCASRLEVTLFQLCLTIYLTFLFKLTGNEDLIIGGLMANRFEAGVESIVGMFVHLVPYRIRVNSRETFSQFVHRVRHLCHEVVSYGYMPFQSIAKFFQSELSLVTTIDIETMEDRYTLDNDLELVPIDLPVRTTQFDLSLTLKHYPTRHRLSCVFDYSSDVFDSSTIERLAQRLHRFIEQILSVDQRPLYQLSLLLDDEEQMLRDWNSPMSITRSTDSIHWTFIHQAREHPQKIAIIMEEQSLSYGELLHYAQQTALYLFRHCHVEVGDIVCQLVERSIEMVVGILAIWMCGAVYTPFSPREPIARLHTRLRRLDARLLLVHSSTRQYFEQTSQLTIVELDRIIEHNNDDRSILPWIPVTSEHLSHIVFTSGSTGEPKMVQLRHRNFVSYIRSCLFQPTDIVLQQASVAFDSHLEEIIGPLISHAQLAILKPDPYHLDLDYFTTAIARHKVTFIFPVPTLLIMLTNFLRSLSNDEQQSHRLKSLRFLSCGGEKLYLITVRDILPFLNPHCSIHNYYGPAECTLATLHYKVTGHEPENGIGLPIGRPMVNARVYILDEFLQNVIPGDIGEIVIGGHGVFVGYRNQEELTGEVLIEHDGDRCYRTGDLGRLDVKTGQIEYLGRRDHQVKIRGQRIELDETEHTIMRCSPTISNCLVLKRSNASVDHLIAYVESNNDNYRTNDEEIRTFCTEHLSPFMVPSFFVVLDKFPLSQSGKIDRARLPPPNINTTSNDERTALSPMERQLCVIVTQAFDLPSSSPLNVNATFAQLGGTSLGIVRVLALIRQQKLAGSHPVDINILLSNPSVRQTGQALESLHPRIIEHDDEAKATEDEDTTMRRSLLIETVGILILVYLFALPIYLALRISLILAPVFHLFSFVVLKTFLSLPQTDEWFSIYSFVYYRWWFLQRLWKLNTPWHELLYGTSLYNTYLRLCGARIGKHVELRTNSIDWPDLVDIGENTFVGEDVVFSSIQCKDNNKFRLSSIRIGTDCSIGARSVLHSGVSLDNRVTVKPLTSIAGSIGAHSLADGLEIQPLHTDDLIQQSSMSVIFSFICLISIWLVHECLLMIAIFVARSLTPVACLLWLVGCACMTLVTLKWMMPKQECWWIRHLIVTAFGFTIPILFDGCDPAAAEQTYPRILRWLDRVRIGDHLRIAVIADLLRMRRHSIDIGSNVTFGGHILFNNADEDSWPIVIRNGASFGNDCIIEAGASIPAKASIGSVTRVDRLPSFEQENQVIVGVPARQTALFAFSTDAHEPHHQSFLPSSSLTRSILVRTIALFLTLGTLHLTILPVWIFLFGSIVCCLYSPTEDASLFSCLSQTLMNDFQRLIGPFLGGTQWLNRFLNTLGANIHRTVLVSDLDCIDDPELITIGPYVRIEQRARVQAHTNEYRRWYTHSVSIGTRSHLMPGAFVLAGCQLQGRNVIYPCTLVMKGDQLPSKTSWHGSPATYHSSSSHCDTE